MNSTGKQKEQVRKKLADTSAVHQSLSKSSGKKSKKRDSELSCGDRIHAFSKQVTKNIWHNNQLELGKTFCDNLWGQHVPESVTLIGVNSEGEEKRYEVYVLGNRLSKRFSEFINHQKVKPDDFISLDPLGENQLKFCIHRVKGLALVGPNSSSDLGQPRAGSMDDTFSPPTGHCGTAGLPLAIDLGLPPASTSEVRNFGEALAEFGSLELAKALKKR